MRLGPVAAALLVAVACAEPAPDPRPIAWDADRRIAGAAAPGATMVLVADGVPAMQPAWAPINWPDDPLACTGSFVGVPASGDTVYAAWRTGKDSTTTSVRVARSANAGIAWDAPTTIGVADRAPTGCTFPPPFIAFDHVAGAVDVVFYAPGRRGLFLSTAPREGGGFGPPVLIAEGGRPVPAAVAAAGDTVAVVYESPTLPVGAMWLAISFGARHIPTMRLALSVPGVRAFAPAVAVGAGHLGAAWNEAPHGSQGPAAIARVGRWTR